MAETPTSTIEAPEIAALQRLIDARETDRARAIARTMDGRIPATETDWAAYCKLLEKLSLLAQAEIATIRFLGETPGSWRARLKLAARLIAAKKPREAQAQIDLVRAAPDASSDYFSQLADVELQLNDWPALLEVTEIGLRFDPEIFRLHHLRGIAHHQLRQPRQAMAAFDTAIAKSGVNVWPVLQIVVTADWLKLPALRDKVFTHALALATASKRQKNWLELIAFLQAKPALVDQTCNAFVAADITDAGVLTAWFDFALVSGPPAAAHAIGTKLLAVTPSTPGLAEKLAKLQKAGLERSSENWWQTVKAQKKP